MRICLVPTDRWAVGSYRVLQPGQELSRLGHDVFGYVDPETLNSGPGNMPVANVLNGDPSEGADADVYVMQRRFEFGIPTTILKLRKAGRVVVSEIDDLYDRLPADSPGWKVLRDFPNRVSVRALNLGAAVSDAVTVSTPALAEHYSRYNPNVHVLPNYLDWDMWADVQQQSEVDRHKTVRVGWMGWLAWRGQDLQILRDILPGFLARNPRVEFVSIGEPQRTKPGHVSVHDYLGVPKRQRRTVFGKPYRQLAEIVPHIDIGLVPLTPNQFNECKSYLKGLEYAACGVPAVATPTQQYREFIRDGETGLLASTPGEWLAALELLVNDSELRREMGRNARAVAETLTIQREVGQWQSLYTGLVSSQSERSTASTAATSGSSQPVAV